MVLKPKKILVLGAGGHARVVADMLRHDPSTVPLGYIARERPADGLSHFGLPVFGDESVLADVDHDGVVLAVGDNRTRQRIHATHCGTEEPVSVIHPSAVIASDAVIEPGCMVCAGVVVNTGTVIRAHSILNTGCTVDHDCVIGPFAHIAPGVTLAGQVTVEEGALVGIGSCVIQSLTIGAWAVVGAGAAVIRDVIHDTVVAGVPARSIK